LDKISKYTSACQEVLVSTSRKKDEENHRHYNALNSLDNCAQQTMKKEADKIRQEFYAFFSSLEQQDDENRRRRNTTGLKKIAVTKNYAIFFLGCTEFTFFLNM
jgi:hypothetical protein